MTHDDLDRELEALEQQIAAAKSGSRHLFQPQLHQLIATVSKAGHEVPARLRELDEELTNDAIEAQFDNLPV
jgi:hypothetical protein